MKGLMSLLALCAPIACSRAVTQVGTPQRITVSDPICGFPGTESGSLRDAMPFGDPRAESREKARIVGEIISVDGWRLAGAMVSVPNTSVGTRADSNGVFTLEMAPNRVVLRFRAIGRLPQDLTLHLIGGRTDTVCVRLRIQPVGLAPIGLFDDIGIPITRPPRPGAP